MIHFGFSMVTTLSKISSSIRRATNSRSSIGNIPSGASLLFTTCLACYFPRYFWQLDGRALTASRFLCKSALANPYSEVGRGRRCSAGCFYKRAASLRFQRKRYGPTFWNFSFCELICLCESRVRWRRNTAISLSPQSGVGKNSCCRSRRRRLSSKFNICKAFTAKPSLDS